MSEKRPDSQGSTPRSPLEERLQRIREDLARRQSERAGLQRSPAIEPATVAIAAISAPVEETSRPVADAAFEEPLLLVSAAPQEEPAPAIEPQGAQEPSLANPAPAEPPSADVSDIPSLHPFASLARLARLFDPDRPADDEGDDSDDAPGPVGMAAMADRLGLVISMESRRPTTLVDADCPCVLLLKDGRSLVIIGAGDRKFLTCETARGAMTFDRALLDARATGGVFIARPRSSAATAESVSTIETVLAEPKTSLLSVVNEGLQQNRSYLAALVAAGAISSLVALSIPVFTMAVFDRVIPHMAFETLWALAIGISILLCADFAIRHAKVKLAEGISVGASQSITAKLFRSLLHAPLAILPRQPSAVIQPFQELAGAGNLAVQFTAALLVDVPFFLIVSIYLWMIGGPIVLLPLIAAGLTLALHLMVHRRITRMTGEDTRLQQMQQQMVIEGITAIETIKALRAGDRFLSQWERKNDEASFSAHKIRTLHGIAAHGSATLSQLLIVATLVLGVYEIRANGMSIGAISACLMLVGRMSAPIGNLAALYFRIQQAALGTRNLRALFDTPPEAGGDVDSPRQAFEGRIDLRSVSFVYPGEEAPSLQGVTLAIAPGEKVGIIGRAGCGKSTLLKMLVRLIEPSTGTYLIDGKNARQVAPAAIRRSFSLMSQDTVLIDGSIDANLRLGLGPVDARHFESVLSLTGVSELTDKHPKGLSLPVGPGGRRLSGGERQAVALSRALIGKPRLLILDEPTAAMDNEREARVIAGLAADYRSYGMVIATHRLPLLALVDRVIVMDQGRVVADGPREEIFRKIGVKAAA
jgi:ATP-binding cassette, subfamily C, bacterial LapB